ncbi:GntR family transcriptional regulator [Nonomuraea salmonea]|uniref:GntR family transcriptional regulator n=1 Tax=Nonomuraea salmonea TaxID=46181 RepID=UPI0031EA1D05
MRIRRALEARIRSGQWGPGTRIPTEVQLCEEFGVSRITVQRALRDLADAGLIVRFRRRGSFVAQAIGQHNLLRFTGLLIQGAEMHGDHRVVAAQVLPARAARLRLPGVPDDEAVVQMERHKLNAAGKVINTELHVLPFRLAPRPARPAVRTVDHPRLPARSRSRAGPRQALRRAVRRRPGRGGAVRARLRHPPSSAGPARPGPAAGRSPSSSKRSSPPGSERFYVETDLSGSSDRH